MRFHAQRVFASAAGDYFQLLLGPEESDEKEFDPYEESGPYLLVQRQFEMPDRGRCYIETHDEGYIGHFPPAVDPPEPHSPCIRDIEKDRQLCRGLVCSERLGV
jgi:hypothetical protein